MDIDAALKDGYSLQEVNQEAAKRVKFNYQQAIQDGYTDDEINQELRRRLKAPAKPKKVEDMKAPTYMGIPEAALGMIAATPAQIAGGLLGFGSMTGDLLKGKLPDMDKAANVVNDVIEHNFGLGQFKGLSDPGKRAIEATPEVMSMPGQFVGKNITGPIGGMIGGEKGALQGEILGQVGTDVGMNFLPIHAALKTPGKVVDAGVAVKNKFKAKPQPTPEITNKLEAIDAQEVAAATPPEVPVPDWRLEHPIAAETRVREQNRKQPTADDYNNRDANVRAVEEEIAAMEAYQRSIAQQREAQMHQESVANLQKLNELNPDGTYKNQTIIDDTPYGGPGKQFGMTEEFGRVDENGIPIRADLSMEAQNLQNPLQRNLWGDELPTRTGDGGLPLTQALDRMPPGPARTEAMRQLRGQRGAIDVDALFKSGMSHRILGFERLPQKERITKAQLDSVLGQKDLPQAEKDLLQQAFLAVQENGVAERRAVGHELNDLMSKYNLTPEQVPDYADYGIDAIRPNDTSEYLMPSTRVYNLNAPTYAKSHFTSDHYFGHTRSFIDDGIRHVVEIQSDLVQANKPKSILSPEELSKTQSLMQKYGELVDITEPHRFGDKPGVYTSLDTMRKINKLYPDNALIFEQYLKDTLNLHTDWDTVFSKLANNPDGLIGFDQNRNYVWGDAVASELQRYLSMLSEDANVVFGEVAQKSEAHYSAWGAKASLEPILPMAKNWNIRLIREELKDASKEGAKVVRFADARTVETVEGWGRDRNGNLGPDHQGLFNRYQKEIEPYLESIGGKRITDREGFGWIEVPVESHRAKPIMFGQRGGVDIKAISEEVAKIGKTLADVGKKTVHVFTPQEDVIRGIIKDNSLIPRGEAPQQIIAKALAEGTDGPPLFKRMQSGLLQAGDKVNSALMKGVARHIAWAEKVADKAFRDNVKPLEQAFSSLSKGELADLMAMRVRAMNRRKAYTPEQLKEAGFTDRQIKVNQYLDENYAAVLEADNAARAKLGLKPITANQAYYASMWNGNYHIPVYDKDGSLSWYIKTESRREATKAIQWLKENQGDLIDTSKLKYDYRPENPSGKIPRDIMGQYEAMLEVFKDTPVGAQIHELMQQSRTEQAYTGRNFDVHFEHKKNVRGFIGDRPWLTHEENGWRGAKAQIQYLKEANRWAPMQEAMGAIKEVVTNPDLLNQQPNNMALTKLYVDNAMGTTKNLVAGLEHAFGQAIGTSPGQMKKFVGTLKTLTYLKHLGFSAGYMIASVAQAIPLGMARHRLISQSGIKHNVFKSFADSMYDTSSILGQHWLDKDGKRIPISETGKEALKYMEDNGLIDVSLFDEYAQLGEHKGVDTAKQVIGLTISFPEKVTRVMTFMSFVHHLKNSGLPKAEMFRLAEEHTQSTLTNFHRSARPLIVDSMGMAGELAYTYKSPMFNFYNSLFEFSAHGKRTGDYSALYTAVMMSGALGGVMNIPAMAEIETGLQALKKAFANAMPKQYASWGQHVPTPKELAMQYLPSAATYGLVSQVTGAQMASRFTNEVVDFEDPLQGTLPAFDVVGDVLGSAADVALHGADKTSLAQATYNLGMPMTKGMTEAGNWLGQFKVGETPMYYNPNKLRERDVQVHRDGKDLLYRKLGLTSLKEASDKDAMWLSRKETARRNDAAQKLLEEAINKVVTQGNIQQEIESYIALGGDTTRLTNGLMRGIQDASMTPQDREIMRARTMNQINGALRRQGMEQ